jgi:hypothetical protein
LGAKKLIASHNDSVNPYSSYYRLNCRRHIRKGIRGLAFDEPEFTYLSRRGWERGYFPRLLWWAPRLYDMVLGDPVPSLRLLMIMKLRRSAPSSSGA